MIYQGGVYQHSDILELVEDLGGYLTQKNEMQTEVSLNLFVPKDDIALLEEKSKALKGELKYAPLAGTDILLVLPSLAFHHMPHPSCDIAEYLRREGATTTLIGLSRGVGKRIAQIKESEKKLIEEYDLAVFVMGIFDACIVEKEEKLLADIDIPTILTGGPEKLDLKYANAYVGGLGRIYHRLKRDSEIKKLDDVLISVIRIIEQKRESISKDPLIIEPPKIMYEIENQIPDIKDVVSPSPVSIQIDGLRVKLPYKEYSGVISEIEFDEGYKLREIAAIKPSLFRQSILVKVKPRSEVTATV